MKRLIEFKDQNESYILEEDGVVVFTIETSDLKFNSLAFYNNIYKGKNPNIELINKIENDTHKKGKYIFNWLSEIISGINDEFSELTNDDATENKPIAKIIPLFEFAACAGDGFFIDNNIPHTEIADLTGEANFAVNISGDSMEPIIKDKDIVFVKSCEELKHNDIGLFIVNGDVMCKRYIKQGRGFKLVPDNANGKHKSFSQKEIETFKLIGKVIV